MKVPLQMALLPYAATSAGGVAPTATLNSGPVFGAPTSLPGAIGPVNKFLGIPYAASPPERFRLPRPPKKWTTPRNATAFGDSCIQYVPKTGEYTVPDSGVEILCLFSPTAVYIFGTDS